MGSNALQVLVGAAPGAQQASCAGPLGLRSSADAMQHLAALDEDLWRLRILFADCTFEQVRMLVGVRCARSWSSLLNIAAGLQIYTPEQVFGLVKVCAAAEIRATECRWVLTM